MATREPHRTSGLYNVDSRVETAILASRPARNLTWRDIIGDGVSGEERLDFVARHIDRFLEPDIQAVMSFSSLTDAQRDELLRRKNFTGITLDDEFYGDEGSFAVATKDDKDRIFSRLDDYAYYNDPDWDASYTVGYSDGTIKRYEGDSERATRRIKRSGAVWVLGGGLASDQFWATAKGLEMMRRHANFTVWENGKKKSPRTDR